MLVLGVHPVQDAAAPGRGGAGRARRRRRARRSTSRRRSPGATSWSRTTPTPGRSAGWKTRGIDLIRGDGRLAGHRRRRGRRRAPHGRARRRGDRRRPVVPPVPGLRELEGVWGTREATSMKEVPRRLLVLGGGAAGVELAQVVRRLGGEVALVEGAEHLLAREPAPLGEALGEALRRGRHRARARRCRPRRRAARATSTCWSSTDGRELRGDRLLVATGRRPRVDGIGLETVGIEPDRARHPGRRPPARRRAPVGHRRRHRHLAAHPRRRVRGRRRRGEHPRRAARGQLRGRAARRLHRPAGGGGRRGRGPVQRHRAAVRGRRRPPPTPTPTPSPTAS